MRKMIVIDLDGTALNSNHQVSTKTKEYLKELKENGYIIVIATGRILRSGINITDGAEFANYIISSGGGSIYDNLNKKIIYQNEIPKKEVETIFSMYKDEMEFIDICNANGYYKYTIKNYKEDKTCKVSKTREKFLDNIDNITHISIISNNGIEELYGLLQEKVPSLDYVKMQDSFSDRIWIDIFGKGTSKYNAIIIVAGKENIENHDIIAFGDGKNDINMIQNCGIGVAMGNALEEVKEVANYITKSNDEDGIIYFLQKYLNNSMAAREKNKKSEIYIKSVF